MPYIFDHWWVSLAFSAELGNADVTTYEVLSILMCGYFSPPAM